MIGKKNIAFGFLYLVITASLGPYMIVKILPDQAAALKEKQVTLGNLQTIKTNDFTKDLDPMKPADIAKANTAGILSLNKLVNVGQELDMPRNAHVHGNLESVLNILAGLALCFIAVGRVFKQIISWLFIAGALLHSGSMLLLTFGIEWANYTLRIGPFLVLAALLTIGIATVIGFRGELVRD
ncbi:MAG: hypothetical protein P8Z75_06280 [Gammaproteobacteria bacterium]|jgi:uncharacterized membrane protein YgdD (TMEM256/DUF423 family)